MDASRGNKDDDSLNIYDLLNDGNDNSILITVS